MFNNLPYVIIQEFGHYLDDSSLLKFTMSCKKVSKAINSDMFYKKRCLSVFESTLLKYNVTEESWKAKYIKCIQLEIEEKILFILWASKCFGRHYIPKCMWQYQILPLLDIK